MEKVAFKSGLNSLSASFLPKIFARIINVLPETFQFFFVTWGGRSRSPLVPPARTPMRSRNVYLSFFAKNLRNKLTEKIVKCSRTLTWPSWLRLSKLKQMTSNWGERTIGLIGNKEYNRRETKLRFPPKSHSGVDLFWRLQRNKAEHLNFVSKSKPTCGKINVDLFLRLRRNKAKDSKLCDQIQTVEVLFQQFSSFPN